MNTNVIHTGDAFDVLPELPEDSVHAVVTDPPYGLAFMGRDWDDFEPREYQTWCENWARRVKRVLRSGGHLLAFSGNRTHHRLFAGVEDAGFEIRDTITYHYGSGFPKALDVGKELDSDAAKKWDGFKTALKPATEYVVVARAPLSEGTVAENVQAWGTGALNIDECRIGSESTTVERDNDSAELGYMGGGEQPANTGSENGRYPANVVFDEQAAEALDADVGDLDAGAHTPQVDGPNSNVYGDRRYTDAPDERRGTDSGGPSRYFYTSKASRSERTENGKIQNDHPTVKPVDLMEWLVTLVTREGQVVLDPFAGSGTTCKAAKANRREFVGIERNPKHADVARVRCGLTPNDASVVRPDENQSGLGDWP